MHLVPKGQPGNVSTYTPSALIGPARFLVGKML